MEHLIAVRFMFSQLNTSGLGAVFRSFGVRTMRFGRFSRCYMFRSGAVVLCTVLCCAVRICCYDKRMRYHAVRIIGCISD